MDPWIPMVVWYAAEIEGGESQLAIRGGMIGYIANESTYCQSV
jgi:hypothetical protein